MDLTIFAAITPAPARIKKPEINVSVFINCPILRPNRSVPGSEFKVSRFRVQCSAFNEGLQSFNPER
jgi:hypothetical protein